MACAVLAVDDDPAMLDTMVTILKGKCDVVTARSAEQALIHLERRTFEVVLSDIRMEGMNGLELLAVIKSRWPSTNVIMISVISEVSVAVEAMRLGAFFYTTKDFDWDPLNDLVQLAVKGGPGDGDHKLREENLKLRRECDDLRSQLRQPTKIEDRRQPKSEIQPALRAG
jgi:two-component system response regulator PilR (NtrC family)